MDKEEQISWIRDQEPERLGRLIQAYAKDNEENGLPEMTERLFSDLAALEGLFTAADA